MSQAIQKRIAYIGAGQMCEAILVVLSVPVPFCRSISCCMM